MLDFAVWVAAAEIELGLQPGEFEQAYAENRLQSYQDYVEGSPFAQAVLTVVSERGGQFNGTATALLQAIKDKRPDGYSGWPKDAARAGSLIRRLAPALRQVGYSVEFLSKTRDGRVMRVRKE